MRFLTLRKSGSGSATSPFTGLNGQTITGNSSGAWAITAAGTAQNITLTPSTTGSVRIEAGATAAALAIYRQGTTYGPATLGFNAGANLEDSIPAATQRYWKTGGTTMLLMGTTGNIMLGGLATEGTGVLQFPTHTTTAGGITFGVGGTHIFSSATNSLEMWVAGARGLLINAGGVFAGISGTVGAPLWSNPNGVSGIYFTSTGQVVNVSANGVAALTLSSTVATFGGIIKPVQATTGGAPAYVLGALYFDTTLNKLRVGGASAWETVTSV